MRLFLHENSENYTICFISTEHDMPMVTDDLSSRMSSHVRREHKALGLVLGSEKKKKKRKGYQTPLHFDGYAAFCVLSVVLLADIHLVKCPFCSYKVF